MRRMLFRTINDLGDVAFEEPALAPVPTEWIGKDDCRLGNYTSSGSEKRSDLAKLAMACKNDTIILHVHGGAFLYVGYLWHRKLLHY